MGYEVSHPQFSHPRRVKLDFCKADTALRFTDAIFYGFPDDGLNDAT